MIRRILIVDDNAANLYLLESLLKGYGLETITAENGQVALEKARCDPPDMIITDILMPVMDGFTLCREWKADEALKHIPFVFFTATYTEPRDEAFALSLGADRFIIKPQDPAVLMEMLYEVLSKTHNAKPAPTKPLGEEMEFFRRHDEALFRKLEKKMLDLEIAHQKLKIVEENYRLSFENVSDVIYVIGADLRIVDVSPSVARILGYEPRDVIGRSVSDLRFILTPESYERALDDLSRVLNGETIRAAVYRFLAKDGTVVYGEVSGSPLMKDGKIVGAISVARDVTDRKQAEEELRRMNAFLDSIVENIPNMIFLKDAKELRYVRFNRAGEALLGYSRNELLGKNDYDFFPKDQADFFTGKDREVLQGRDPVDIPEEPLHTRAKGLRILHTKKAPILNADGEPEYLLGISEDITEYKMAEEKLRQTLASLNRAIQATIQVMISAVEARDPYTAGHQARVADLAQAIAREMNLGQEKIDALRLAASVHDIGKLSIPAEILSKPMELTDIERSLIEEHARIGFEILKNVESPWPLAEIVYQHHERMDGSGYPRRLKGTDILLEARILGVADVAEAMASHRPYRAGRGIEDALQEIEDQKGLSYDPDVADACLRLFREKGYRFPEEQ